MSTQQYNKAHELLLKASLLIKDVSFKISKLLCWEILKVHLYQYSVDREAGPDLQDLLKRAKSCVTTMQVELGALYIQFYIKYT